jgi:pimeloyl-ACP methyl ester carboxylesterase
VRSLENHSSGALAAWASNKYSPPLGALGKIHTPLVVLTSDAPYPEVTQPGIPAGFNTVIRQAQDVSQRKVAQLVPGAKHVTKTDSGHNIMLVNPVLVSDSILEVVTAVREGRTRILK